MLAPSCRCLIVARRRQFVVLLAALAAWPIFVSLDVRDNAIGGESLSVLFHVLRQQCRRALLLRDRQHALGPCLQRVRLEGNAMSPSHAELSHLNEVRCGAQRCAACSPLVHHRDPTAPRPAPRLPRSYQPAHQRGHAGRHHQVEAWREYRCEHGRPRRSLGPRLTLFREHAASPLAGLPHYA